MSFHRPNDAGSASQRWRISHRSLLSECGIPDAVANSDRAWAYLQLHGDDSPNTKWNVSWISPQQAARLLKQLDRDLPCEAGYDLVRLLRQRAAAE